MTKQEILDNIKNSIKPENLSKARNSMGVSESFYDAFYLTGKCFNETELNEMSEKELNNIITLASFAADAFY